MSLAMKIFIALVLAIVAGLLYGLIGMVATPVGPAAIVGCLLGGAFVELPLLLSEDSEENRKHNAELRQKYAGRI